MQKLDKLRPPPIDPNGSTGQPPLQLHLSRQMFHDPHQGILVTPIEDPQQPPTSFGLAAPPPTGSPSLFVAVPDWSTGNTMWTTAPTDGPPREPTSAVLHQREPHDAPPASALPAPPTFTTTNTGHTHPPNGASGTGGNVFYSPQAIRVNNPYTLIRRDSSMFLSSPTSSTTGQSPFNLASGTPFTVHTAYVTPGGFLNAPPPQNLQSSTMPLSPGTPGLTGPHHSHSHSSSSASSKFKDPQVAQRIVASVGLPLTVQSLSDFIREGQPPPLPNGGTGHIKGRRNFPNCDSPPPLPGAAVTGSGGGLVPPPAYVVSAESSTPTEKPKKSGWSVESTDAPTTSFDLSMPPASAIPVSSAFDQPATPQGVSPSPFAGHLKARPKSDNEVLTDLLHFHANFFPPPPPPRLPPQERRRRVELWYHYASKWDITRRLPPPPRTPLPEMELEYKYNLKPLTKVPYHGNDWLEMCMHWFNVVQHLFDYPEENEAVPLNVAVLVQHAVLGA